MRDFMVNSFVEVSNLLKMVLAEDLRTHPSILEELSIEGKWLVDRELARNPNTPIEILVKLSKDRFWEVRYNIARNPSTPIEMLGILCNDDNELIAQQANIHLLYRTKEILDKKPNGTYWNYYGK
jgi:hypothetical protein